LLQGCNRRTKDELAGIQHLANSGLNFLPKGQMLLR
jgi:hypothetical protein